MGTCHEERGSGAQCTRSAHLCKLASQDALKQRDEREAEATPARPEKRSDLVWREPRHVLYLCDAAVAQVEREPDQLRHILLVFPLRCEHGCRIDAQRVEVEVIRRYTARHHAR